MDLQELLARLEADGASALSDEELAFIDEALAATVETVDLTNPSAEDITALETANAAIDTVRAEVEARSVAAAERAERAAELAQRLRPEPVATDGGDGVVLTAVAVEGDAESTESDDDATEATDDAESTAPANDAEAVPVAASATPPARPTLAAIARRVPVRNRPEPRRTAGTVITASADIPGVPAGQALDSAGLDAAILGRLRAVSNMPAAAGGAKFPVARIQTEFPTDRVLSEGDATHNQRVLDAVTAAGGPCAPLEVDYSIGIVGTNERPLRAALPQFQASRGGVRFQQPPKIGDFAAGVSVWTQATDASAGALDGSTTKPCVRINCGNEVTAITEAIPVCGTIGNWVARNFDERVQAFRQLLGIEAARFTEARHLAAIDAGSTQWSAGQLLGTTRDVLAAVDRAVAVLRNRYRMSDSESITCLAPDWLIPQMRTDVTRQLPGDDELGTTEAEIVDWFARRDLQPTLLLDETNGASFGAIANGGIPPWPSTVKVRLFPTGSWKHLDDGTLDLSVSGPYHDSVLNKTNDAQIWMETFENVYFQGTWSVTLTLDTCPSGETAATVDTSALCTSGS